eukprot:scaffold98322_cov46-Phaeocystis_antarctica.AAC.3
MGQWALGQWRIAALGRWVRWGIGVLVPVARQACSAARSAAWSAVPCAARRAARPAPRGSTAAQRRAPPAPPARAVAACPARVPASASPRHPWRWATRALGPGPPPPRRRQFHPWPGSARCSARRRRARAPCTAPSSARPPRGACPPDTRPSQHRRRGRRGLTPPQGPHLSSPWATPRRIWPGHVHAPPGWVDAGTRRARDPASTPRHARPSPG